MKPLRVLITVFFSLILSSCFKNAQLPQSTVLENLPAEVRGKLNLYILAGQSNMSGHGKLRDKDREVKPDIFIFGNDYRWHSGSEPVDDATGQIDSVSNDGLTAIHDSLGPGMAFASAIKKKTNQKFIGLIPCAMGGTTIVQWQKNLKRTSLYGSCLNRVKTTLSMGKVSGLLFFQGEADAITTPQQPGEKRSPTNWDKKFIQFVEDFRKDINNKNLPVVFAKIGKTTFMESFENWQKIQHLQDKVSYPHVSMIRTDDLPLEDGLHFNSSAYDSIGERFAEKISEMK